MNLKFGTLLIGLSTVLFLQTKSLSAQQIPASELPPSEAETGLEGKYDPQNGIAQLIRDKSSESAASKIFEDEHVLVFMPLPEEEVVVPGHVLVVPKRLGRAKFVGPQAGRDVCPARCGSKSWDRTEKRTGSNRFQSAVK